MMINYHVLHHKSHFSCGLATGKPHEILDVAKEKGITSVAITDINTMSGVIEAYKNSDGDVIIGTQLTVYQGEEINNFDIVLLASNQDGYQNLCRLVTQANMSYERSTFRMVSIDILGEFCNGLYCLSRHPQFDSHFYNLFGDRLFYELTANASFIDSNRAIIGKILPSRIVITPDSSIVNYRDKELQDIMITNTKFVKEAVILPNPRPILSQRELITECLVNHPYIPQQILMSALQNTATVGNDCCQIQLKFEDQLVDYPHLLHPLNLDGCSKEELALRIVKDNGMFDLTDQIYAERLGYEMKVITRNSRINLIDYFLVIEDTIRFCESNDITVGPGRGSGAGSLLNYGLRITKLDPIQCKLLFERFISEGRINAGTLPDIDMDFSEPNKVKEYWMEMYGTDRVVPIGTMQTLQAKGALKDVFHARHPEVPFEVVNKITKNFPDKKQEESELQYLERAVEESEFVEAQLKTYPLAHDTIQELLGVNRQPSVHPCFSEDSKILTSEGYKTFKECDGTRQEILTPNGWGDAVIFKQPIKKEVFLHKISMSNKSRAFIESKNTSDHTFLCDDGFLPLSFGGNLSLKNHNDFDGDLVVLGWVWNNGYYCPTHKHLVACVTPEKDDEFLCLISKLPEGRRKINLGKDYSQKLIDLYGYDKNRTYKKESPLNAYRWSFYEKTSFLRGMFSANGSVIRKEIRIKLSSERLVIGISELLRSLGIETPQYVKNKGKRVKFSNGEYQCRDSYCLTINSTDSKTFMMLIGFTQTYKNERILKELKFNVTKEITSLGHQDVYDFTVLEGTPAGYVNGFWAHNCGLAITEAVISDIAPLRYNNKRWSLEYNGDDAEFVGIIKYDALGLKTLKFIQTACDLAGIKDPWSLPLDDKATFRAFENGLTTGVFQFNSQVSVNILTQIAIESLEDLTMTTSVGRPGTMANKVHLDFIQLKNGKMKVKAPHPMLEEELRETYGVMIYQENVMKAAQILGGYSIEEADTIRKAMGKKKPELLIEFEKRFIQNCIDMGYSTEEEAQEIWQLMATFAGYGFNKSHAMAYSMIGYICMYLKVHHPLEWWTSCFAHEDKPDRIKEFYRAARGCINLPDINRSEDKYLIMDEMIQMPVTGIKFVGQKACDDIVEKRPFIDFDDFYERVNKSVVNVRVMKNLIVSGAFQHIDDRKYSELINRMYERKGKPVPEELQELTFGRLLELRGQVLDFISINYYDVHHNEFIDSDLYNVSSIQGLEDEVPVTIGGKLIELKQRRTRKGDDFGALTIENDNAIVRVTLWNKEYKKFKNKLVEGEIYKIHGKTTLYEKNVQLVCNKIYTIQECKDGVDKK